jgi:hypothetical protein
MGLLTKQLRGVEMAEQNFTTDFDNFGGIYVLKCPITQKIKYIGQTNNFKRREIQHHYKSNYSFLLKKWCAGLEKEGLKPIFEILLICDDSKQKDKIESALIDKLSNGLLNVMGGGIKSQPYLLKYMRYYQK